jgi:chorismate mutase/prephenate dehydrogenase
LKLLKIIEESRKQISAIDEKILELIKEREILSSSIGQAKRSLSLSDKDSKREEEVLLRAINKAQKLELPVRLVKALQQILMDISLIRQEKDRIKQAQNKSLTILIIGGAGRMGAWLSDFFSNSSHKVSIFDKTIPSNLQKALKNQDLVVLATPIGATKEILLDLPKYLDKKTIIFDISSVKNLLKDSLEDLKNQGFLVTSLHPMFGPSIEYLFGKHIIRTSLGVSIADDLAASLFKNTSLKLVDMSFDEHDKIISYLLSLSHLINLLFVQCLKYSPYTLSFLSNFCSTTFYNQLSIAKKVFDENPHLYFEIQKLNPYSEKIYDDLEQALKTITSFVKNNQKDLFVSMMKQNQDFLLK